MPWTPTLAVINSRAIAENLLTFFEANQVDAILWANGSALKPFQRFENSRANLDLPAYPAILFSDDNDQTSHGDDLLTAGYSALFLVMVQNPVPATAVLQARMYAKAIMSMIANCTGSSLEANTGCVNAVLQDTQVGFDQIKVNEAGNDWMQQFEVRATYTLMAGANI
jgi:hypothetical protein